MGQKTFEQRLVRAKFCLEKALCEKRFLDAKQQQRRIKKIQKLTTKQSAMLKESIHA